jgi:hypothetical protein
MDFLKHSKIRQQIPNPASYEPNFEQEPHKSRGLGKVMVLIIFVLLIGASGAAAYFYKQYDSVKNNPNKVASDEVAQVTDEVGKLMVLPTDEQPTLATVTDPSKLKDQPFFANAKEGYKVLIYAKAKKAILYSPEDNKIVDVAPVNLGDENAPQTSGTQTQTNTSTDTQNSTSDITNKK